MEYLIHGSIVYDNILKFNGNFHQYILPNNLEKLNVSFPLNNVSLEFGGTGGNIYKTSQLIKKMGGIFNSVDSNLFTHIGSNSEQFINHWKEKDIYPSMVIHSSKDITATCFILSSKTDNQITSFYSGVMNEKLPLEMIDFNKYSHILLSPENPSNTIALAHKVIENKASFYFDPGQCLPFFINYFPDELAFLVKNMTGLFVNEYESMQLVDFFQKNSQYADYQIENISDLFSINKNLNFIVNTLGSNGVLAFDRTHSLKLPVAPINKAVDPTGCGDSFRAGFFNSFLNNDSFEDSIIKGIITSSFIVEQTGCNIDKVEYKDIENRYKNFQNTLRSNNIVRKKKIS